MWAWKIGPAIATGNTVVLKTAEQTPLSALYVAKLIVEAGFPPGVINILSGFGHVAGAAISKHMDIDKVAFTGSTVVGRAIMRAAADSNLKKVTLELGGKSPNIIFDDANIDEAISWANFGIFFNHGQCCSAGSRLLVQEGIYDKFVARFKERAAENKLGDPFEEDTYQGPQVSQLQFDRIMGYLESGKKEGAVVVTGGSRHGSEGYFIQPTVFTNVTSNMRIAREEIFGPVVTIQKFKDEAEAIKIGNNTAYGMYPPNIRPRSLPRLKLIMSTGLAGAVFTQNVKTAVRMSNALRAGYASLPLFHLDDPLTVIRRTVWINSYGNLTYQAPFGGFKESGIGRELGSYALENYTQVKTVRHNLDDSGAP